MHGVCPEDVQPLHTPPKGVLSGEFMCASLQSRQGIRVVLAENNSIHAELLASAIARDRRLNVVHSTCHSEDLLSQVPQLQPDVVVLSACLDENYERGFEVIEQLHSIHPELKMVVLLDRSDPEKVVKAFRTGARGVFCRNLPVKRLSKCIRVVHEGQIWASNEELGFVFQALAESPVPRPLNSKGFSQLSKRERDVVYCLAEGMSNREIAERLCISPYTVKNYMFKIFDRLGVSSRVELLFCVMSESANANIHALQASEATANGPAMGAGRMQESSARPVKSASAASTQSDTGWAR